MRVFLFVLGLLFSNISIAQNPAYFNYSVENGAPSNDIYSIIQDKKGYIWIGCDAGVFRYNGVRFTEFTSSKLASKSATGLVESKSGRIYGYTFNKQLFYIENEKLCVFKNWHIPVTRIAADKKGFVWVTTTDGLYRIQESNLKIEYIKNRIIKGEKKNYFSSQAISDKNGNIFFQQAQSIYLKTPNQLKRFPIENKSIAHFLLLSCGSKKPWIVDITGEFIYRFNGKKFHRYQNQQLLRALKGRKINHVFETDNHKLWIATYSGLVCLDIPSGKTETLLEQFSFSNGIQDREGNYWFSTIHNGIIRIPNMDIRLWKTYNENHNSDQYSHLQLDKNDVYIASNTGIIGKLENTSTSFSIYNHLPKSDIGMMHFSRKDDCIYFNKLNQLYRFKNGKIDIVNVSVGPLKSMVDVSSGYFLASSQGLFFIKSIDEKVTMQNIIDADWYREIIKSPFRNHLIAATNNGISIISSKKGRFSVERKILRKKQIISLAYDPFKKQVFALSFDGLIYLLDKNYELKIIKKVDASFIPIQIRVHSGNIFLATNKGILKINPEQNNEIKYNKYFGLSSNNIRSLEFDNKYCWAIGEGLQKIPIKSFFEENTRGFIRARAIWINGIKKPLKSQYELNYFDNVSFGFDGLYYSSNGDYDFAYRMNGSENSWTIVPGKIEKIELANLPSGQNSIEFKLIDHNNLDSRNTITLSFDVIPPFWQRWWFYLLITLITMALAFGVFRWRLISLRKKQFKELIRLRLENELRLTQQNALKAQMNPHFLFNVLNSIKGYIYENDKKNAARYLSDFSSLVRKVLELSALANVSLFEELETLKIYIELEAMLLHSDFSYDIIIDDSVELNEIQVPSLILQPYVENAFKHGLRHKKGTKNLIIKLNFNRIDSFLEIEILDNGIGRDASNLLNKANEKIHDSFASSAIDKRIKLLNYRRKDVVGVEITDKFEGKEATGTIVKIRIHV